MPLSTIFQGSIIIIIVILSTNINKKFHKKGWILKISSLQLKLSISGNLLGRALLCYVPKKKNLGRLIYRNDADVLGSCHSLFLANHRSSNQIALMESFDDKLQYHLKSIDVNILACNFMFFKKQLFT
jgi:hypothetical protein